ncbi:MAG TPA: Fe-S cluster assembly protein SufD [Tissierellaceae bacterium]|nr:Fe-S cluster assembly protein SufD [Tissierellaceae bacterium]
MIKIPNWKRISLDKLEFPEVADYTKEYINLDKQLPTGVELNRITDKEKKSFTDYLNKDNIHGVGKAFVSFVDKSYNSGISLYLPEDSKIDEPIRLDFKMNKENPNLIDQNIIVAESNSEVTLIFDYSTEDNIKAFHNGITRVYAKENSVINIVKVQRLNDISNSFDSNVAFVEGHGEVNWISVELGSSISGASYTTYLNDDASESNLESIYLGDGNRNMDLEYTVILKGRHSIGNIETHGVLMDQSKKVFRGNLDFKRGAKSSKGSEEEFTILMDSTVVSHSIPALLCDEDNVEGHHAASAGQIDDNQLFYLMSRGLSERESKKLIVEASFSPIIDQIPSKELRDIINNEVDRRLMNA